ncbi:Leucine-responsive regulatory protein [Hartmannibacter diazotrophicus]|uniref:Leucine-responsive regulatory protein n=1 Tax=Hartmannibacter diazotrophicus TaxID=1482074 RepID=A0A2C9D334_9HYPH|nr:Lrp/AsnC ligand binding domain-containing protein [Hartmannibacter diazotrophicus]SON54191.1 Leucine-responsive regulatory protein [Hartmannibacter diazotrophicus]
MTLTDGSSTGVESLDRIDRKILAALQTDGRITNLDLADKVGLSPTATAERVKRLTRDGFILGYAAQLDPVKLGRGLLVFVEIKLDRMTPEVFSTFAAAVTRAPAVLECHMIAGGFDYLVKARVGNMDEYRSFLSDVLMTLPGVRETHTYPVMEEVKNTVHLPL